MTCGTLLEFCAEDFAIPPKLPPPPPILSYYFEDNQINSSFYCDFCSNLEASLDPLHKQYGGGPSGAGGLFSTSTQNLIFMLFIVALISAAVGSAVTVVWKKWFRCRDGGILSKAFGGSNSPHSADISGSPDGRRRSRTASLGSTSALHNLQKRLSSSSFISRRSVYQQHPNIISGHHRPGAATMANNTYCECPSNMMMMVCASQSSGDGGNNMNISGTSTTTSLTPSVTTPMNINPSAPTASSLSISGGNVYAELDPVSVPQTHLHPPLPPYPPPGEPLHPMAGVVPMMIANNGTASPVTILGGAPGSNQYVLSHRRRVPAPLPPIPMGMSELCGHHQIDQTLSHNGCMPLAIGQMIGGGGIGAVHMPNVVGEENINQLEMNDLNEIYYSDLDCKQLQL